MVTKNCFGHSRYWNIPQGHSCAAPKIHVCSKAQNRFFSFFFSLFFLKFVLFDMDREKKLLHYLFTSLNFTWKTIASSSSAPSSLLFHFIWKKKNITQFLSLSLYFFITCTDRFTSKNFFTSNFHSKKKEISFLPSFVRSSVRCFVWSQAFFPFSPEDWKIVNSCPWLYLVG